MKIRKKKRKKKQESGKGQCDIYLMDVSSETNPESSSSEGALLALREPWREVCFEVVGEVVRDASREAALRETVLPLSKIWRRRSGILTSYERVGRKEEV